jgi:hypothetical protein
LPAEVLLTLKANRKEAKTDLTKILKNKVTKVMAML